MAERDENSDLMERFRDVKIISDVSAETLSQQSAHTKFVLQCGRDDRMLQRQKGRYEVPITSSYDVRD